MYYVNNSSILDFNSLENKDVCKVSNDQRTIRTLPEYQEIFYKKAANKKSKYPLFFSILS